MNLPEALALFEYWQTSPPVHEVVAAYVGYKAPKPISAAVQDEFPMADFIAAANAVNASPLPMVN